MKKDKVLSEYPFNNDNCFKSGEPLVAQIVRKLPAMQETQV